MTEQGPEPTKKQLERWLASQKAEYVPVDDQEMRPEPGKKWDKGKLRYDLLPADVMEDITAIYTMGAEKYGDRNWEQGMSWGRVFGAAMRHIWSFWRGRDMDSESRWPHLAHAIVNLMFLHAYWRRGVGTDDREANNE